MGIICKPNIMWHVPQIGCIKLQFFKVSDGWFHLFQNFLRSNGNAKSCNAPNDDWRDCWLQVFPFTGVKCRHKLCYPKKSLSVGNCHLFHKVWISKCKVFSTWCMHVWIAYTWIVPCEIVNGWVVYREIGRLLPKTQC